MAKRKPSRHTFHFGVPGRDGTVSIPCPVSRGKTTITITRSLDDVKKGKPGMAMACADMVCAQRHKDKFPHKIHFAEFTRSRAYIVDEMKNGIPTHCVVYEHDDNSIPLFDKRGGKQKLIREGGAERKITLRPPEDRPKYGYAKGRKSGPFDGSKSTQLSQGSRRRAIEAGLAMSPAKALARFQIAA